MQAHTLPHAHSYAEARGCRMQAHTLPHAGSYVWLLRLGGDLERGSNGTADMSAADMSAGDMSAGSLRESLSSAAKRMAK
jgi:hypothetical protein